MQVMRQNISKFLLWHVSNVGTRVETMTKVAKIVGTCVHESIPYIKSLIILLIFFLLLENSLQQTKQGYFSSFEKFEDKINLLLVVHLTLYVVEFEIGLGDRQISDIQV